jgi:thiosulfate/3-mercaptopyruvate sulfurtransferase
MPRPLISVEELAAIVDDPSTRIIDCRWYLEEPDKGLAEYRRGHISGAGYASLDIDLSGAEGQGRHPLPTPGAFADTLARFGITVSTPVVVYDDRGGSIAARLWWMLTDQSHTNVSVLDGGIQAWTRQGFGTTTVEPVHQRGDFKTRPWRGVVDRTAVIARSSDSLLMDARSLERYRGDEEPVDPKAGHIPGAISIPQTENLSDDLAFLSPDTLRDRFSRAGITGANGDIAHCGSGVTACHNILAMEVAGITRPWLYVGSWSDWSSADLPVATGDTP